MVKLTKNKLKQLNKLTKKHSASPTNKILKKKQNLEKKVKFQKEILIKETVKSDSLVKIVNSKSDIPKSLAVKPQEKSKKSKNVEKKPKLRPVEKKKTRQKTQAYDTKMILGLMKKKFNDNGDMGKTN